MSNEGKEEVIKQDQAAKSERDIHSVPFFVVNDHYTFSGAQVKFCFCTVFWFKHFLDILSLWDSGFKGLCAICFGTGCCDHHEDTPKGNEKLIEGIRWLAIKYVEEMSDPHRMVAAHR